MDATALTAYLAAEGQRLAGAAAAAAAGPLGWDTPAPGLDWDVRQVVTHVGGVHRWATQVVSGAPPEHVEAASAVVGVGPPDDELVDWLGLGYEALVSALAAAPDDLDAVTFLPAESPKHFWARRQAHETAIHRADVENAAGGAPDYDADFAQDGIAELLLGFARRRANAIPAPGTLGLDAVDGASWLLTFGGERIEAVPTEDLTGTDVTVRGLSSDLYLWLWNRPSEAFADGDPDVAALWSSVRVSWS
jgi:uncharacterized protein (TIGR03083 family)